MTSPEHEGGRALSPQHPAPETTCRQAADLGQQGSPTALSATTAEECERCARFERFHEQNPHVYALLVSYCREWASATGRRRFGIRAPWERMRWQLAITTTGDAFKLNDHYAPFYARLIAYQEPDLRELFETRRAAEADAWAAGLGGAA